MKYKNMLIIVAFKLQLIHLGFNLFQQGKHKTKQFAAMKRMINLKDQRM